MADEQWMEFIRQSIESHDHQLGELAESQAKTSAQIAEMRAAMAERDVRMDAMIANTQLNFDRLALAMAGLVEHVTDHARRIDSLEGKGA